MDQRQFWRHSLAVAILSKIVGKKLLKVKKDQENAYLAGLMHDMGMLVFCFLVPEEYAEFLKTVPALDGTLPQMELAKFGIDHHELGGLFISKYWHLDPAIVQAVKECNSDSLNTATPTCSLAVTFADSLVNDAGIIVGVKTKTLVPVKKDALKNMGISSEDLSAMVKEMKNGLESMEMALNGK